MRLFELDDAKCVKCALCVRDCAFRALKIGEDGRPVLPDEAKCMKCQHCFAICPKGAITFDGRSPGDSVPAAGLPLPKGEEVENWLRVRRSCRQFRDADVDRRLVERILKCLGNTPTGCNARGLTFTCYPTRESMKAFKTRFIHAIERHRDGPRLLPRSIAIPAIKMRRGGEDIFFRGAPAMLIVSADEKNPATATPQQDVIIACANFEMLAQAHGLATCWCGFLKMVQLEVPEILEQTSGLSRSTPFYAMLFGYPAVRYARGVQRDGYAKVVFDEQGET